MKPTLLLLAPALGGLILFSVPAAASPLAGDDDAPAEPRLEFDARSIGPAGMSGRVAAIEARVDEPTTIYVGAATGGLWRTRDGGLGWENLMTDEPVASIGAIAIFAPRPDIVWVGTGEGNPRNSAAGGKGLWRSVDGGRSFQFKGLAGTEKIHRIVLHPSDPNVAWVAALGTSWGENEERGVYRTRDGGDSWERVLFVDERTGCADLAIDPSNPDRLLAAMWDHRREPHFFRSGGPGSGLWSSVDGGDSWERIEEGLPTGELGRIGLAFSRSNPDVVYALVEAEASALLRSDDGGFTWRSVNTDTNVSPRPFYYADIRVDPADPDRVYRLASTVEVSNDGGKSFETLVPWSLVHPDHHALWIHPDDPNFLIDGNDGGVAISRDHGSSWRFVRNLPLAQFCHLQVDMDRPYHVYGGMQDNGSWRGPSAVWENGGIRNHHWEEVGFGDGFGTLPMPDDTLRGYAMSQGGMLMRWDLRTGERKVIRPDGPDGVKLRFNWNAAIAQDPFDPQTIYYGSQFVHRSRDRGDTWEIVSGDLTTDTREWQRQAESGGLTLDVTDAENYCSIVTIAPSPLDPKLVWVGTDDGRLHVTRDGGETWTSVEENLIGVPANTWIPHVEASKHDPAVAYAVFDDHYRANWQPYVYRTADYGVSWTSLATDELDGYAHVIEEDPVDPKLLFLGTEFGLWWSQNGGRAWRKWTEGVPTVSVRALVVHPREHDLVIGTHGRAAFVIDDVSPLRALKAAREDVLHLFEPREAIQYTVKQTGASRFPGSEEFRGENVPYGAMLTFWLDRERAEAEHAGEANASESPAGVAEGDGARSDGVESGADSDATEDAASDEEGPSESAGDIAKAEDDAVEAADSDALPERATVEILDGEGAIIRTFETDAKHGLNRFQWRLRRKGYPRVGFDPQSKDEPGGAEVLPGRYRVRIRLGEWSSERDLLVAADPRESISIEDRRAKAAAQERLGQANERAARAVLRIQRLRKDVQHLLAKADEDVDPRAKEDEHPLAELKKAGKELLDALKETEELFWTPPPTKGIPAEEAASNELGTAGWFLGSSREAPTPAQLKQLEKGEAKLESALAALTELEAGALASFRAKVTEAGLALLR